MATATDPSMCSVCGAFDAAFAKFLWPLVGLCDALCGQMLVTVYYSVRDIDV